MRLSLLLLMLAATLGLLAAQEAPPAAPAAHFHHLHLNTTDPAGAIEFYTSKFDCEKGKFAGVMDAVWAQKSWMLFAKVSKSPDTSLNSAIWHFGWGAEDMKAAYQKQLDMDTKFETPLTDISDLTGGTANSGRFFFAYVQSPEGALIELNTANHHHFGHLHLFSEDPVAAGEWYVKNLGLTRRGTGTPSREPRFYHGLQVGPSYTVVADNVNIIIFPAGYARKAYPDAWKNHETFESTKGHVVDHVGFSFDNLPEALERLRQNGVKVTDEIRTAAGGKIKYAFMEGPDKIRIELVEGTAQKD